MMGMHNKYHFTHSSREDRANDMVIKGGPHVKSSSQVDENETYQKLLLGSQLLSSRTYTIVSGGLSGLWGRTSRTVYARQVLGAARATDRHVLYSRLIHVVGVLGIAT